MHVKNRVGVLDLFGIYVKMLKQNNILCKFWTGWNPMNCSNLQFRFAHCTRVAATNG